MSSSVVFVGSPDRCFLKKPYNQPENYYELFIVPPGDLLFRIFASFIPPITLKFRKVYVDFLGPLLAFFSLTAFLIYGYSFKKYKIAVTPLESMLFYYTCIPLLCFFLAKLGRSTVTFCETLSLLGYSVYGHLFTLVLSFIFFHETSNGFFFVSLIIFAGASSLRLILVFLNTIPVPAARLLVCSTISSLNILFLIYLHFGFMHRTFA